MRRCTNILSTSSDRATKKYMLSKVGFVSFNLDKNVFLPILSPNA